MLETKLQEIALGILGNKIVDEDEKKKVSDELHSLERKLNDDIARVLRDLRGHLDSGSLENRFNPSERDNIVRKVGEEIGDSRYAGI